MLLTTPGYCPRHAHRHAVMREGGGGKPAFVNARRTNYELYRTKRWRDLKRQQLTATPYCTICGAKRSDGAQLQVHHVIPPRGDEDIFYDSGNLQVICLTCHRKITGSELSARKTGMGVGKT